MWDSTKCLIATHAVNSLECAAAIIVQL